MKQLGRKHRPYYRICAMDIRRPRDGRVLEELGTYDPMIPETDARAVLNGERIAHWLSVGAQPSDKVRVLIKKYGEKGTHAAVQQAALDRLAQSRRRPEPPAPMPKTPKPAAPAKETPVAAAEETTEQPVEDNPKPAEEEPREEASTTEQES
ncbi:MAG: 30S ribosomal protein S16 [Planctomycetes bacterium]|nr:30S ribosomal protein S16 [Planctomycetota bacterium]